MKKIESLKNTRYKKDYAALTEQEVGALSQEDIKRLRKIGDSLGKPVPTEAEILKSRKSQTAAALNARDPDVQKFNALSKQISELKTQGLEMQAKLDADSKKS